MKVMLVKSSSDLNLYNFYCFLSRIAVGIPNDRPRYYCVAVLHVNQSSNDLGEGSSLQHYLQQEHDINVDPQIRNSIPELNVVEVSTASDSHIKQISNFLDSSIDTTVLRVPENVLKNDSAWCFDIVCPHDRRSSCFTHSYGRYIRGTGSILYEYDQTTTEPSRSIPTLISPEEREYDKDWSKDLDTSKLRYFSGSELCHLFGFSDDFSFPPDTTLKQQWKLIGNSLNVLVASQLIQLGLSLSQ